MTGADGIGPQRSRAAMAAVGLTLLLLTGACASPFERPAPLDDGPLRARAVTKTDDGIRVSAAVPSRDESRSIFGVDLDQRGIQPLWLEIENGSERSVYFLPTGLDPEYFAPLEVAFLYGGPFHDEGKAALAAHLEALSFDSRSPILPGETVTGFVYVNRADPSMMVQVDLIGREWSDSIGLVVPVPGTEAAQQRMAALRGLYTESDVVEIDDEPALRSALEELPCCAADQTGARSLPLNVVLIGKLDEWGPAFVGRNYRYAPASPWHAFGRMQDLSGHRISRWVAPQPHTLRVWLTPLRYQGKPIWVGQVSTAPGRAICGVRRGNAAHRARRGRCPQRYRAGSALFAGASQSRLRERGGERKRRGAPADVRCRVLSYRRLARRDVVRPPPGRALADPVLRLGADRRPSRTDNRGFNRAVACGLPGHSQRRRQ